MNCITLSDTLRDVKLEWKQKIFQLEKISQFEINFLIDFIIEETHKMLLS